MAQDEEGRGAALPSPTQCEQEIDLLINALAKDPQSAMETFAKLMTKASEYVQSTTTASNDDHGTTASTQFKAHQLCKLCETNRSDQHGKQLEAAFRFRLQTCMLRSLSFISKGKIAQWIQNLAQCIQACPECYKGYCRAKEDIGPTFLHTYDQTNINTFLDFCLNWEGKVAKETLEKSGSAANQNKVVFDSKSLNKERIPDINGTTDEQTSTSSPSQDTLDLSGAQLYFILQLVGTLAAKGQRNGLYEQLRDIRHRLPVASLPDVPSGLFVYALDADQAVRSWAEDSLANLSSAASLSDHSAQSSSTIGLLVSQAMKDGNIEAFTLAMKAAPHAFSGSALPNTLLANLSHDTVRTSSILMCLQKLLEVQGSSVWLQEDREYPLVVLSSILDNAGYASCIANSTATSDFFAWIAPFIGSLVPSFNDDGESARNVEGDSAFASDQVIKVYSEGLKRVCHFLLERIQQTSTPYNSRIAAAMQCVRLLNSRLHSYEASVQDDDRASNATPFRKATLVTLHQVTALHSAALANLAFRARLPNASETTIDANEVQKEALSFVEAIFLLDCQSMIDGLLSLSEKATQHQRVYKRSLRDLQGKGGKDVSETERREQEDTSVREIFTRASADLDGVSVLVCTELWKDAYNLCKPSAHVTTFLVPLSKLSAYSEPQIKSYIVTAKERHASTSAYVQYKERLKAVMLSASRRLRAMRGSLPLLLLDVSEATPIKQLLGAHISSTAIDLQTLCLASADSLMSLNLCAEAEVHKAAQNVIRTAFEDAESRADCFRSLLQFNPKLALQGIQHFLEQFVEAATSLIEANEAAKWMVRSFSDVLDVLCSDTDGLLRSGTPFSFLDQPNALADAQLYLPPIWLLMCKSVAIIFKRTPSWSRILPHDELTAWFRDVILFATEAVVHVKLFQDVSAKGSKASMSESELDEREQTRRDMLSDLSLPLEEASSWFRMNDLGIVQETRDYFVQGLRCFQGDQDGAALPKGVKERMLSFIDSQSKVEDDEQRTTLLSLSELAELRMLLDPSRGISESSDERSDDDEPMIVSENLVQQKPTTKEANMMPERDIATKDVGKTKSPAVLSSQDKKKTKQTRLQFQPIDSDLARKQPFTSKAVPLPPQPRFAAPAGSANRYQGANARPSAPPSAPRLPERPATKMAQLRQDFRATHTVWKPNKASRFGATNREMPEPRAPEAKRTFAVAPPMQKASNAAVQQSKSTGIDGSSDSSSDSDSSADEKVGLADLASQKKASPAKMRTKFKPTHPNVRRSAIMLEDHAAIRAKREREEADRKRRLRETPSFSPLHRVILSWNYFAEGDIPPHLTGNGQENALQAIRSTYRNAEEYVKVFEPMLLLECWAEVQAAREQVAKGSKDHVPFQVTISGRSNVDMFDSIAITMQPVSRGVNQVMFQDTDLVYLREMAATLGGKRRTVLAKVDAFKLHPHGSRLTVRCCVTDSHSGMSSILTPGAALEMGKMFSLTTMHRAYEALQALRYYDMLPNILLARAALPERLSSAEELEAQKRYAVNEPQARAVLSAIKAQHGFHLIQGPPGTGKTKTICSLVAHFLQERKAPAAPIRAGQPSNNGAPTAGFAMVKKKILLCAPSNAAVDEVAKRVHQGVRLANGTLVRPNVVRVGREDAMNIAVKTISLEAMVEKRIANTSSSQKSQEASNASDPAQMQAEIRSLKDQRDNKRAQLESAREAGAASKVIEQLEAEMRNISAKRMDLMGKLDVAKDLRQTVSRQKDADRRRFQQEVLMQADVVCSTLGGAGHHILSNLPLDFETVVIDEAAQAVELDTLIPLRYGCQKCILVGDPNQLPPTVISREAERLKYSQSLFVRLFNNPANQSNLLSIQYRMHPHISQFPSQAFYDGKLQDGPDMRSLTEKAWHRDDLLRPLRFFDCRNSVEGVGRTGHSYVNKAEAEMAAALYERLRRAAQRETQSVNESLDGKVGVVTMYKDQVFELKRAFRSLYGEGIEDVVDFNTVDGFQGQEKDVIILSCVRSNGIGFLNDFRRINVAITRAKSNLFVIANVGNLERNDRGSFWSQFIDIARKNKDLRSVTSDAFRQPYNAMAASTQTTTARVAPSRQDYAAFSNGSSDRKKANQAVNARPPRGAPSAPRAMASNSNLNPKRSADDPEGVDSTNGAQKATANKKARLENNSSSNGLPPKSFISGSTRAPAQQPTRPRPPRPVAQSAKVPTPKNGGIPIVMPGQVAASSTRAPSSRPLESRPNPRPRPPPPPPPPLRDGPSAQATASLFMPKSTMRPPRRR